MKNQRCTKDLLILGTIYTSFQPLAQVDAILISNGQVKKLLQLKEVYEIKKLNLKEVEFQEKLNDDNYLEWETENMKFIKLGADQMIMPGIIDSHVHPQSGGIQLGRLRIQQYSSWVNARKAIYESICDGEHDKQDWVFVYGYSQGWFKEIAQNIDDLDYICPDKPLVIMRDDCHAYWCNSKVLEITKTSHNQGIFIEEQMNIVRRFIPKMSKEEQISTLLAGLNHLVQNGIIAFQDAAVKERLFQNYIKLYSKDNFYNVLPYCCMSICWNDLFLEQTQNYDESMKLETVEEQIRIIKKLNIDKLYCNSVKIFADGVLESQTALMNVKYCQCNHNGQLMIQDLPQLLEDLNDRGIQAHIHSVGDASTDLILNSYEAISHKLNKNTINYLAHLQFVSENAFNLFKRLNLGANFSPIWFYENYESSIVPTCLPDNYFQGMYPIKELETCTIGFGSDWPVSSPNPFYALEVAVTRQPLGHDKALIILGDLAQKISLQKALHYYTEGSAKLIQKPGLGILKENSPANFIILSQNLFNIKPQEIHQTIVLQTYIKGQRVYQAQCI